MANDHRVFVGRLPHDARERDLDKLFKDFKIRDINLKLGYAFVDLSSKRDAEDACYDLNGKYMLGSRVVVEMSKPKRRHEDGDRFRGGYDRGGYGGRRNDYGDRRGNGNSRSNVPYSTKYRLIVENLSQRLIWKDLKDMFKGVTYADAHKKEEGEGIVHFETYEDLKRTIKEYDGKEVEGKRLRLIDDTDREYRRSPPERRDRSRSRSPLRSRSRTRSPVNDRSRSYSKTPKSRSRSGSRD